MENHPGTVYMGLLTGPVHQALGFPVFYKRAACLGFREGGKLPAV